ncbi:hypothetical protein WR25_04121 isoform B [Diploscapter pachys]|uniref:IBB domain-containing protein n=1 Tax=Diploscapter pachys TaxID=2018661 RepID=A0A2A2L119_9BILA|nr:hypothetical protein WR25_04121 isoform B [Diploscapter pachys]
MENQRASPFEKYFKSNSLCEEELRKRRREDLVVIRKQKKELLIEQRRFDQSKYIEPLAPSIASENHSFSSLLQGGSLSGDSQVIDSLIQQIKSSTDSYAQRAVMRDLLFALSLLIGDSVVRRNEAIDSGIVGHIVHVNNLGINDRDARGEALRACAQMCEWSVVWRMMYEEDILAQLVLLLDQRKDLVELFYILKVIDTITQNTSMYSIYLIRFGLFRFLSCLLPIPVVGQDVCFILSNLVAEGQRLIDMIFDTGFIPQLAAVLENADCETRKEASHALCRCICFTRNSEHLRVIVDLHILQQLADLLTVMDAQLISQVLIVTFYS